LVAIEDLTEVTAREATREAQLQEAEALLHEAQHRTANDLAMISAILGMKAKSVTPEETRNELEGARRRLVPMATIERQTFILATLALQLKAKATLANSTVGMRVELCCESQNG
jgi:two-component sensor histidine kinase